MKYTQSWMINYSRFKSRTMSSQYANEYVELIFEKWHSLLWEIEEWELRKEKVSNNNEDNRNIKVIYQSPFCAKLINSNHWSLNEHFWHLVHATMIIMIIKWQRCQKVDFNTPTKSPVNTSTNSSNTKCWFRAITWG